MLVVTVLCLAVGLMEVGGVCLCVLCMNILMSFSERLQSLHMEFRYALNLITCTLYRRSSEEVLKNTKFISMQVSLQYDLRKRQDLLRSITGRSR